MAWEIVVGIETHAQLLTRSKIFSGAATAFGAAPNTQASAVDIALPGVLPVLNRGAVELAIRFGLAVGGPEVIRRRSVFARKNYFYPDLPKGYQISQFELPIVTGGSIQIETESGSKTVRLTRAHLEEDAGKSLHEDFHGMSGIDLNRAGTPLLEIVTEPDLRGAKEAVAYARALHSLVRWIGICDGNMQEGSFRCDANVSVRRAGDAALGTRCEIKNLNSFRFMEQAIEFEARRQIELIEDGKAVEQETRLYDPGRNETRSMRLKEDAQDYRYFPDPDLLPLVVSEQDIERIRSEMPELPGARFRRFTDQLAIAPATARVLVGDKVLSDYFEETAQGASPEVVRQAANWIAVSTNARLNDRNIGIADAPVRPRQVRQLIERVVDGTISGKIAKEIDEVMWSAGGTPDEIIEKRGLKQISDTGAIEKIVDEVLVANAKQVADYRSGKEKAFNSLVGQVMKASKGKANPAQVNDILRRRLKG
ncbi:MAG: Asp-tRNA(Asn)/Glu-tRNA(Gln) amidotransferase subunit GatB [Burkholderiales bacterium]|nr:Asp-tRNA(Asn)/Glu-tRNA(Gln) amidotransferase subunit GatB [Burkholderiales bacterium]